jgi:hydrogenase maturation protease
MKVLGLGNPTRGDDAAGARVVRLLQGLGIEARVLQREPLELLEVWRPEDDVVVIDAVLSGAPCGTIQTWNRASLALPGPASASTHSLGLAETIELARALGRLPKRLTVFGIEGRQFALGARMSPEVERAAADLARSIALRAERAT